MKSFGPKSLIELDSTQTVLSRQLYILRWTYPTADIVVVIGHDADRMIKHIPRGVKVVENENHAETNVARSLAMGIRVANHNNVLVVYGDLVFNGATFNNVTDNGSLVLVDSQNQMGEEEVGINIIDGRVSYFGYGITPRWAQIVYLTGRELELFKKSASVPDRSRLFGFEILNHVIDSGGRFRAIEPRGMRIAEIDSSKDIEKARMIADSKSCPIMKVGI